MRVLGLCQAFSKEQKRKQAILQIPAKNYVETSNNRENIFLKLFFIKNGQRKTA